MKKKSQEEQTEVKISQNDSDNDQKGLQFLFSKIDLSSQNVKDEVAKLVNKDFGLMPYRANYILPFSYSSKKYQKRYSNLQNSNEIYNSNVESEFQLSLQKNLSYNLFGFNEYITLGYTQHVWWQLYTDSAPFRETNYTPEIFVTVPTSYEFDHLSNLKAIRFGYRHQSNGQDGYRSRSWDRLFLASFWQWDNLFLRAEAWYRIPEKKKSSAFYNGTNINDKGDDNPDIQKYLGYGELELRYLYGDHQLGLKLRNNLRSENKGSVEIDWSVPIYNSNNTYWYMKAFNGYGESLIDYDQTTSKISFGFSFFRNLF
jgi:phospholipase A1